MKKEVEVGEGGGRQIDVRPLLNGNNLEISENLNAENCLWRQDLTPGWRCQDAEEK